MRLDLKTLKYLEVETVSGKTLGHVYNLEIEIDGQAVVQYWVKPSFVSRKEYLVSRDQIVEFTDRKIIVDDAVVRDGGIEARQSASAKTEPAALSERS
ncbi:MAG: PRC-barrel domain-containing protein [Patescibacteria group bacterium]